MKPLSGRSAPCTSPLGPPSPPATDSAPTVDERCNFYWDDEDENLFPNDPDVRKKAGQDREIAERRANASFEYQNLMSKPRARTTSELPGLQCWLALSRQIIFRGLGNGLQSGSRQWSSHSQQSSILNPPSLIAVQGR